MNSNFFPALRPRRCYSPHAKKKSTNHKKEITNWTLFETKITITYQAINIEAHSSPHMIPYSQHLSPFLWLSNGKQNFWHLFWQSPGHNTTTFLCSSPYHSFAHSLTCCSSNFFWLTTLTTLYNKLLQPSCCKQCNFEHFIHTKSDNNSTEIAREPPPPQYNPTKLICMILCSGNCC